MLKNVTILLFFLCVLISHTRETESIKKQFRYATAQLLWEKAHRKNLEISMMEKLAEDLQGFSDRAMEMKRSMPGAAHRREIDKIFQEEVRAILVRYGLGPPRPHDENYYKYESRRHIRPRRFEYKELDDLWESIKDKEFYRELDLNKIELELHHHKDKLDKMNRIKNELNKYYAAEDNEVEQTDVEQFEINKGKMEDMKKEVEESNERIQLKIKKAENPRTTPFSEPLVAHMWDRVKILEVSPEEMRSIREELSQLELKIEKQRFFKERLEHSTAKQIYYEQTGEDIGDHRLQQHQKLLDKVEDLEKQVQQYNQSLHDKIEHHEL